MKCLLRACFTFISALSLLLCLSAAGLIPRSQFAGDTLRFQRRPGPEASRVENTNAPPPAAPCAFWQAAGGRLRVFWSGGEAGAKGAAPPGRWEFAAYQAKARPTDLEQVEEAPLPGLKIDRDWRVLRYRAGSAVGDFALLSLPLWLAALVFAVPPLAWLLSRRRQAGGAKGEEEVASCELRVEVGGRDS